MWRRMWFGQELLWTYVNRSVGTQVRYSCVWKAWIYTKWGLESGGSTKGKSGSTMKKLPRCLHFERLARLVDRNNW